MDGGNANGEKVTTKSGHISDVEYEPQKPQLEDDLPPTDQEELDKLDASVDKKKGLKLLATPSGKIRDRLDSLFNSRLEERIRQLQTFRSQIEDIQAKNKRDHVAKQIEIAKVMDKLTRTRDRLETVTTELAEERREVLSRPREIQATTATLTGHVKRSGIRTTLLVPAYDFADDIRAPAPILETNDDGNLWGIGAAALATDDIPPRIVFECHLDQSKVKIRDWNEEWQTLLPKVLSRHLSTKYIAMRKLAEIQENFHSTISILGKRIIEEYKMPYIHKSLKPNALPNRRKGMGELDANDVLKQHTYKEGQWRHVYVFSNIRFEVTDEDADFYEDVDSAAKAASNELRAVNLLGFDAIEQELCLPLCAILDYRGYRVLCTAVLPDMAEPKDLIDVYGHAAELGDEEASTAWEDQQKKLHQRLSRLGVAANIKPHVIRVDDVIEEVIMASDVQMFIGKDRKQYLMSVRRVLPPEPPTYPMQGDSWHLWRTVRPELLMSSPTPVNPDCFTNFCGRKNREDNKALRMMFNRLKKNVIPGFAHFLDQHSEDDPTVESRLSIMMHRHGINMRFLGIVGRAVTGTRVRRVIISEIVARVLKHDLRKRWRNQVDKGQSSSLAYATRAVLVFNYLLIRSPESDDYWEKTVGPGIRECFIGAIALKGDQSWQKLVDKQAVARRLTQMAGIVWVRWPTQVLAERDKLMSPDILDIKERIKGGSVVPPECNPGYSFMIEALRTDHTPLKIACLKSASDSFEKCLAVRLGTHPGVLSSSGDAQLELSSFLQFFPSRAALERAENAYRRALCVRPQWKEILQRLGDVHVAQSKLSRVHETAVRLRARAGARYLQALCFQWELDNSVKGVKLHRLDHLFALPRGDLAAVSMASARFTDFKTVNFSTTKEVGASALRRGAANKKPVLVSLSVAGCLNFDDDVLKYIAKKCTNTLRSLDMSHCLKIGTEGISAVALLTGLTKLILDRATGVDDPALRLVFKECNKLEHLSLRDLPRVTNISVNYIGKFINTIQFLDISNTPQLTGSIFNEVAQMCPRFRVARGDGCYLIDDVPLITMGRCCKTIEEVSLANCVKITSLALRGIANKCKMLTTINLAGCIKIDDAALGCLCEKGAFPNLQNIDLTSCDMLTSDAVVDLANAIPRLRQLRLGKVTQISERAIDRISQICRRLEDLALDSCVGCTVEATSQVARRCTELKILSLSNCPLVDDTTLSSISLCLSGLTHLDLSGCKMITDKTLAGVVKANTALTHLNLYGCPKLGNRSLQALGEHCAELKYFSMAVTSAVQDKGVMRLVSGCPMLQDLYMTNCPQISQEIKGLIRMQMPWLNVVT